MSIDSIASFEAAIQSAEELRRKGDLAGSFRCYQELLAQRLIGRNTDKPTSQTLQGGDLIVIERLADLSVLFGYTEAANNLLNGMAVLCRQAGNHYAADYTTLKRIHLALGRGGVDEAEKLLQNMASTIGDWKTISFSNSGWSQWETERHWPNTNEADRAVLFSRLYLSLGWLWVAKGQYIRGLSILNRALVHTGSHAPPLAHQTIIPLQLIITRALLEQGDLVAVETNLTTLESRIDIQKQPGFYIQWLELWGKLNLLEGELGAALERFKRTVHFCQERGFQQAVMTAAINMAHIQTYLNQTSEARQILMAVKTRAATLNDRRSEARAAGLLYLTQARGQSMVGGVPIAPSISEMWQGTKNNQGASIETKYQSHLNLPQSSNYLTYFEDRTLGFYWQLGLCDLVTAAQMFTEIQRDFGSTDSQLIQVRLKVLEGILSYYQNQVEKAEVIFSQTRPILENLGLKPELWQAQRFLGWCWVKLKRPLAQQHILTEETDALLTGITQSLTAPDQAVFMLNKWTADEEYIAGEIDYLVRLKRQAETGIWFLRHWRRWQVMRRLSDLMHHIDRYKDKRARRTLTGSEIEIEPSVCPTLWQRLLSHSKDQVTLSFLVLPDRILVVRTGRLSLDFGVSPVTRIHVRDLVRHWHELAARSMSQQLNRGLYFGEDDQSDSPSLEDIKAVINQESKIVSTNLAKDLQIPEFLRSLPQQVKAITIVPDDSLHGFPFASIINNDDYLVKQYAVSLAFENYHQSHRTKPSIAHLKIMVVGISQGVAGRVSPLPGVLKETELLEQWLLHHFTDNEDILIHKLLNQAAKKEAILGGLPQAKLLHIACHGIFEHNRPDASGFILIPQTNQLEILSLRELSQLDLCNLQHATLSSCWSADHFVLPGRWVISLPETLWRAGTDSILGSLWEVNDRVAIAFMIRFYENLDKMPRIEALRQAQLDCLNNRLPGCEGMDTTNPFYWAGFTLYGKSGRLKL